jgi:hypothetical protein
MDKDREGKGANMFCSNTEQKRRTSWLLSPVVPSRVATAITAASTQLSPPRPPLLTRGLGYSLATGKPIQSDNLI